MLSYCEKHDTFRIKDVCGLCEGVFEGTIEALGFILEDHEIKAKVVRKELVITEFIEFGERKGYLTPANTKLYQEGRQPVRRWVEIEPNTWVAEVIPQKWEWFE